MLERARERTERPRLGVEPAVANAQDLDFPDEHFDTVTSTLVLSTIPDYRRAAEMRRVLKPGGRLLVLDIVRSPIAAVRWIQEMIQPIVAQYAG